MEKTMRMRVIGRVSTSEGYRLKVEPEFQAGLTGLSEFSHILVLWGFHQLEWDGKTLVMPPPYRKLTHEIGIFATRGPFRPSPVALSSARVLSVDIDAGIVTLDWIDAEDGSPVIDIKAYHPSEDIVRDYAMPSWCAHWPKCREDSGDFDWDSEFTFG